MVGVGVIENVWVVYFKISDVLFMFCDLSNIIFVFKLLGFLRFGSVKLFVLNVFGVIDLDLVFENVWEGLGDFDFIWV